MLALGRGGGEGDMASIGGKQAASGAEKKSDKVAAKRGAVRTNYTALGL